MACLPQSGTHTKEVLSLQRQLIGSPGSIPLQVVAGGDTVHRPRGK
jgi:hypothetical protein